MIKHTTALLAALAVMTTVNAANKVTLNSTSGTPGGVATVSVGLENDPGIVAMQLTVPLPEGVDYVDGSCAATGDRLAGHSLSAAQKGRDLVILVYDISLTEIATGTGRVMTFGVRLGNEPGDYTLAPDVRLSDASGNAVKTTVENGTVTILTPKLGLSNEVIDFGRSAIRSSYTQSLTLTNTGNQPLHVSNIESSATDIVVTPAALDIEPGNSESVTVTYSPTERAASITQKLTVKSDAINGDGIVTVKAIPFSVNELHIDAAQGVSGEEVTVTARMNNMEPITAADFVIALPEGLDYVPGSAAPADRAAGFSVSGNVIDGRLRIVMFSTANKTVDGNDGELITFRLAANVTYGSYWLNPENVKLANVTGENMTSATSGNYVSIAAPIISGGDSFDMGECNYAEDIVKPYSVSNNGNAPLVIDRVVFFSDGYAVATPLPLTIEPYSSATFDVKVTSSKSGYFKTTMNVYSNDPATPMKTVNVSGRAYEPNAIKVTGEANESRDCFTLHFDMDNFTDITAVQLDIDWLEGMTTSKADMTLSSRAADHIYEVANIAPGKYRVLIFSMSNTPITGNEGTIFDLTFHGTDFAGSQLTVSDIKLSNSDGKDYTSPDASLLTIVYAGSIELDTSTKTANNGETFTLVATVLPENATNKTVTWNSSNTKIATVDDNGLVTILKDGECSIIAMTADGTALTAECNLTVLTDVESIIADDNAVFDVYNLSGMLQYSGMTKAGFASLPAGLYIVNGQKILKTEL